MHSKLLFIADEPVQYMAIVVTAVFPPGADLTPMRSLLRGGAEKGAIVEPYFRLLGILVPVLLREPGSEFAAGRDGEGESQNDEPSADLVLRLALVGAVR